MRLLCVFCHREVGELVIDPDFLPLVGRCPECYARMTANLLEAEGQ